MSRHTHTYADLEVSPETYEDIRKRLEALGGDYLSHYSVADHSGRVGLALQGVRLVPEIKGGEDDAQAPGLL